MIPHRLRLRWRRGDPIFHGLNLEASSRVVKRSQFAVAPLDVPRGTTCGHPRVCLIHSGPSGCAPKKNRVCLSVPRNRLESGAIRLQQVWVGEQIVRIFWFLGEPEYFLWHMGIGTVAHIDGYLVKRDAWKGVDDLPEGIGERPPAKPPQIGDGTIRKLQAESLSMHRGVIGPSHNIRTSVWPVITLHKSDRHGPMMHSAPEPRPAEPVSETPRRPTADRRKFVGS